MSKITTERYDPIRIERIRHFLESSTEKGKPKFYEIFVDNLKAVDKTDDTGCFDEYKMYMDENTQMIKVLIYTSTENCPRNDKFIFSVRNPQEEKRQEQLNGIDFQNKIDLAIQQERDRTQLLQLQKELSITKSQLKEAEEYADTLQDKLEQTQSEFKQFKEKRISLSEMNTGRLVGFMTNYFIKAYPSLAQKVPVMKNLQTS
jgi:ATP-dependent Lon protease